MRHRSGDRASDICRRVRAVYERRAEQYARQTRRYATYPGLREEVADFVASLSPGPVLDIGCGSGRDGRWMAELGRPVVYGDGAHRMLTASTGLVERTRAVCCDVRSLPFADRVFAGVLASGVLLHLPRAGCAGALREIHRVLAVDGRTLVSMKTGTGEGWRVSAEFPSARWFSYHQPAEFAALCASSGFTIVDTQVSHRRDWFTVAAVRTRTG